MFKILLFVSSIVSLMLFSLWSYERKIHFQTIKKLATCEAELKATQENLVKYTELYSELKRKCELDKTKIEQKYTALIKKATEPIPQISIPPRTDECEALKEMLDEASKHISP
jgi:alcohol dehydrogenase class IV